MSGTPLTVVGIGADGWAGLGERAREALRAARTIVGSQRQLDLLPDDLAARRRLLPSPLEPLIDELASGVAEATCVVASGDPMLHGIGATLARRIPPARLTVIPHPSAFALACARLGWPAAEVALVSAVAREPEVIAQALQPGRRIVAYATGSDGAAQLARVLRERGRGPSRFVVLEQLGGPAEQLRESTADAWGDAAADPLHAVAIEVRAASDALPLARVPGLPDDAYEHDGQLTKRHVRAITLAALAPLPGELLWDVGGGAGSIAIEWLRAETTARAVAVEADTERAQRIARNARTLGVPRLRVHHGRAPEALDEVDTAAPDAIFVGGGVAAPGVLKRCWEALRPGGRIVADAVTLEGEQALVAARIRHGGTLLRIELSHAEPLGSLEGWKPQRPVVQWSARKPADGAGAVPLGEPAA
ncbi:MAG TPA: precorrin-6y C5,15-methyltransferase (decarboxylating) subunit CbiE [Conexibacter sp.]|nr:precorrin-6y C5,15-methyltransferase (decarboxylating) subunit CbiE [Conexibacter sp.]